jgi:hypothetical protein
MTACLSFLAEASRILYVALFRRDGRMCYIGG